NVACIGGGPAGLFLSLLLKKHRPDWDVAVYEQNPRGNTFGWGIVFSDGTMENLRAADETVARETEASLAHWDDIEVRFKGRVLQSSGHGFIGVGRHRFLEILTERAEALGVHLHFESRLTGPEAFPAADLIVAADGVNSVVRNAYAEAFGTEVATWDNRFTWLGTHRPFPAFTFDFQETAHGWFQAHCYQFSDDTSTFIVECPEATWRAAGLDRMTKADSLAFCETLFADLLEGHRLMDNAPHLDGPAMWLTFPKITNARWHHENIVLLGDASATAHFSIGSGTKLALESALALAEHSMARGDEPLEDVLAAYEDERRVEVLKLQNAARNSTEWFESVALRADFDPEQFAYSLLTRSQRVSHENLRLRDADWLENYERWWAAQQESEAAAVPPMFVPFRVRAAELVNRVAVSPMAMYSAEDGVVTDFHLVHLGQRALGGAGLVFSEMTCVAPDARITPGCAGLWTDEQAEAYARIVRFIHQNSPAKAALQLGHAGPKGSVKKPWKAGGDDNTPLDDGNWPLLAPSAMPYLPHNQTPKAMDPADMDRVRDQFVAAAQRGVAAGFDWLELHCAHGYLLSAFLSPLTNHRTDEYGGSVENRVRYPLEVFDAIRVVWPDNKPISVRISAVDWVEDGNTVEDAVAVARAFAEHGADLIDVSSGQVSPEQQPVYGRMYQTPFAERIRLETGVKTMAVGNIYEPDHVNSILAAGRADLCLLARPHLSDPHWTLRAAAELGYTDQWWPPQYRSAKRQIERLFERQRALP
ncbi:MAG: bifunctional salicylyl-CoA 5-hydroxylase/oxidoreductase, partial [Rhodothermaceae bacterium]|nr:bifunctional salicylyl-CoA 5-hydroxylase/oxidoreductase [Rhodothermaceae bacterium]